MYSIRVRVRVRIRVMIRVRVKSLLDRRTVRMTITSMRLQGQVWGEGQR